MKRWETETGSAPLDYRGSFMTRKPDRALIYLKCQCFLHGPIVSALLLSTWCLSTICWGKDTGAFQIPHHGSVASTSTATESWFDKVEMIKRRFRFLIRCHSALKIHKQCKSPSISPFIRFLVLIFHVSVCRYSLGLHPGQKASLMQIYTLPMISDSHVCLIEHPLLLLLAHLFSTCEPKHTHRCWGLCLSSPPSPWKKPFIWLLFCIKR